MVKWGLSYGLVYPHYRHADWEVGDTEEIFLDLLRSKDGWGRGFLEGAFYCIKGVVWVVCHSLELFPLN